MTARGHLNTGSAPAAGPTVHQNLPLTPRGALFALLSRGGRRGALGNLRPHGGMHLFFRKETHFREIKTCDPCTGKQLAQPIVLKSSFENHNPGE